jgi:phage gpG-like protein
VPEDGVEIRGADLVFNRLRRLEEKARDTRAVARRAGSYMLKETDRTFEAGGRPRWKRLAPSTVKQRGSSGPILQRSRELRRGFQIQYLAGGGFRITNRVFYFRFHQLGTKRVAQRKMLVFRAENRREIGSLFRRHFADR